MAQHFEMLHPRIRNIWEDLGRLGDDYLLISGTAAVLHLGHRTSRDIDLITSLALPHPRRIREVIGHPEQKWTPIIGQADQCPSPPVVPLLHAALGQIAVSIHRIRCPAPRP